MDVLESNIVQLPRCRLLLFHCNVQSMGLQPLRYTFESPGDTAFSSFL